MARAGVPEGDQGPFAWIYIRFGIYRLPDLLFRAWFDAFQRQVEEQFLR